MTATPLGRRTRRRRGGATYTRGRPALECMLGWAGSALGCRRRILLLPARSLTRPSRLGSRAENLSVFRKVGTLSTFHFREMNGYDFSFILLFHMYFRHGARATMEVWKRLEEQHNWTDSYAQVAWRLKVSNFKLVFLYRFIQFQFHLNYNTSLNFLSKMRSDMLYFYFSDKSNILIILSQQFRYTISTLIFKILN